MTEHITVIPLAASKATGQKGVWVKVPKCGPGGCVVEIQATALTGTIAIEGTLDDDPNGSAPVSVQKWFDDKGSSPSTSFTASGIAYLTGSCPPKWVRMNFVAYTSDTALAIKMKTIHP